MLRYMAKSKIHGATVTEACLLYEGSITIARDIMETADLLPLERVQVVNLSNGTRLETYVIEGEAGSGIICLNGPAARAAVVGDKVHIISYAFYNEDDLRTLEMKNIKLEAGNQLRRD